MQPCTTRGSDKSLENVRASVLFDAIVGSPSARLATKFPARRPSGAVQHFNRIAESSRRSQTHSTKPQQLGRQALDADAVEAEQLSLVVSEGCSVSIERHGCHSHSCVRDSTHTRPILHTSCSFRAKQGAPQLTWPLRLDRCVRRKRNNGFLSLTGRFAT